eukprot:TRINITY_DN10367_c2_g1_i2.p1 TRINITY_DN10367_c2_g1~~TRINITY_DN10367_c2_g1_i2.p1  ORF type:complete len:607 (-),score=66.68 TRINITY_DN10367_c2_g1_i2:257-1999(-)
MVTSADGLVKMKEQHERLLHYVKSWMDAQELTMMQICMERQPCSPLQTDQHQRPSGETGSSRPSTLLGMPRPSRHTDTLRPSATLGLARSSSGSSTLWHTSAFSASFDDAPTVGSKEVREATGKECRFRRCCRTIVESDGFAGFISLCIVSNAVLLGYQIEQLPEPDTALFEVISAIYACIFLAEILIRIATHGLGIFSRKGWNLFDLGVVGLSQVELAALFLDIERDGFSQTLLRVTQILRLARFLRILRILRIFTQLRALIRAICFTLASCLPTLIVLVVFNFFFAAIFTEAVRSYLGDMRDMQDESTPLRQLRKYYSSLSLAMMSNFQALTGGVSWGEISDPLGELGWVYTALFSVYIFVGVFAVFNTITGIFCEIAIETARRGKANRMKAHDEDRQMHVSGLEELFAEISDQSRGLLTCEALEMHMSDKNVAAHFDQLGLSVDSCSNFFTLLDTECKGALNEAEFVDGCLRLRGAARCIDLKELMHNHVLIASSLKSITTIMKSHMQPERKPLTIPAHSNDSLALAPVLSRLESPPPHSSPLLEAFSPFPLGDGIVASIVDEEVLKPVNCLRICPI